jgi:Na+/H+ antiporter NhaD/arsenite permease-like protein
VKLFILLVALAMYALVVVFIHRKALIALAAAGLVLVVGILYPGPGMVTLGRAFGHLVNWNILAIYVGSLVIADLFIYSRVPAALADRVVERSPTLGLAIVAILVITGVVSAFVENVATVLLMAPIALEVCRRVKIDPTAFMVGLAVMANLQGTATLVGDPPSMIFASYAGYGFNDFFFHGGRPSIFFVVQVGAVTGALFFYQYFRKLPKLHLDIPVEKVVSWVPTVLLVAMIVGLATISFVTSEGLHPSAGILCMVLAVLGLAWFVFLRHEPAEKARELVKRLDWETILFLVGVFVVVGAIADIGLLDDLAELLAGVVGGNVLVGFAVIVAVSVLVSGFVDNVPYIIAMLPVAHSLSTSLGVRGELLMFGLLVGSCMGGNLTPFGASANVVAVGIIKKEGHPVSFLKWLRIGAPFTVLTTAAAALVLYAIWR